MHQVHVLHSSIDTSESDTSETFGEIRIRGTAEKRHEHGSRHELMSVPINAHPDSNL